MTVSMQARPTTYNGIEMRSRLEARVAAFLDDLGLTWEYEPQAFGNRRRQYLPDFRWRDTYGRAIYLEVRGNVDSLAKLDLVYAQMETILSSDSDAILVWADADMLEYGEISWRHPASGRWEGTLVAELARLCGKPMCEHYRLPEYGQ